MNIRTELTSHDILDILFKTWELGKERKIFKGPSSTWTRVFENHKVRIIPKTKGKPYCAAIQSAYLALTISFKSFHGKPVVSKGGSWCYSEVGSSKQNFSQFSFFVLSLTCEFA